MKSKSVNRFEHKTEKTLNTGDCDINFYSSLRPGDKPHAETKMTFVPIKVNIRKNLESHIFTGEDPSKIKKEGIQRFYTPSHILFNSEYVEKKPKINPLKKKKYEIEKKIQESEKNPIKHPRNIMQRRINDNYLVNPMKILTREETKTYNDEITKRNEGRTSTYIAILGSKGYSRTLGGIKRPKSQANIKVNYNKITDNNFDITKRSMQLNKGNNNEVPYYGKKHPTRVQYGKGHFGYL